ncbi:PREDICTED: ATP-dependent DNA helicase pif1-like [Priapulus caudatus]|uniref:ATP-dependent DNA helicase n=1 Tax=Priapulus caudatus TaxID=37621 RepID=A0ABM1F8U5_PRICU|nr:PREDICTED: ATP-dependent DNA helicase pif1-like [Priapulus caudatus]
MLQDIPGIDVPFGSKIFLMGGDFRQVLPVVPKQSQTIIENCLKRSILWPHFKVVKLTKNMRTRKNQQHYAQWLLQLGNGELNSQLTNAPPSSIEIPSQCNIISEQDNIVDAVFTNVSVPQELSNSVIPTPLNETLNDKVIKKLPGLSKTYTSTDKAISHDENEANNYSMEFLYSITPTGIPPHRLILKPGAIIMLLRNLDITKEFYNGTRLYIRNLHDYILDAEILTRSHVSQRVLILRVKLAPSDANISFTLQRIQFSIRLAYSMTINKSQGQSFNKLGLYLPAPVFSHGQLCCLFTCQRLLQHLHQSGQTFITRPFQQQDPHAKCHLQGNLLKD